MPLKPYQTYSFIRKISSTNELKHSFSSLNVLFQALDIEFNNIIPKNVLLKKNYIKVNTEQECYVCLFKNNVVTKELTGSDTYEIEHRLASKNNIFVQVWKTENLSDSSFDRELVDPKNIYFMNLNKIKLEFSDTFVGYVNLFLLDNSYFTKIEDSSEMIIRHNSNKELPFAVHQTKYLNGSVFVPQMISRDSSRSGLSDNKTIIKFSKDVSASCNGMVEGILI